MPGHAWRVWVLAAVVAAVLGSGVTAAALKGPPTAEAAPPDEWDPRVAPLADWVAHQRRLTFEHPVPVDFLTPDQYAKEAGGTSTDLSDKEQAAADRLTRLYRAVGLVSGDVDLGEQTRSIEGEGTLAFYDPETARIRVLGTEMTVARRVTVVHELTHVLQDQYFDLSRLQGTGADGAHMAFRALAEGDAQRMERAYVDELGGSEKEAYQDESSDQGGGSIVGAAPALLSLFGAPYVLGDQLVRMVDEVEGEAAVDEAFRNPPQSDESLIDPFAYLNRDGTTLVASPETRPGETRFDDGDFGALTWLLVLGARIDHHVALQAVDGWGGDSFVAFERGAVTCVRAVFVGDTGADTEEMAAALAQWSAAMPPGTTSVSRPGAGVQMEACDPGAGTELSFTPGYEHILALPATRADVAREFVAHGTPRSVARCIGQGVVDHFSTQDLGDPQALVGAPGFGEAMREIVAGCNTG